MKRIDYGNREVNAKIVYYGPAMCGKTTNLQYIHGITRPINRSELTSLPTADDRTLFFDFLPLELGEIHGFKIRLHLYTVPGQVIHNATRKMILKGVDGIVFVADSAYEKREENIESLRNLETNLEEQGKDIKKIPLILQLNKRDLSSAMPHDLMLQELQLNQNWPWRDGIATLGMSVLETMMDAARMVVHSISTAELNVSSGLQGAENRARK